MLLTLAEAGNLEALSKLRQLAHEMGGIYLVDTFY
jgi:hypothetical protein